MICDNGDRQDVYGFRKQRVRDSGERVNRILMENPYCGEGGDRRPQPLPGWAPAARGWWTRLVDGDFVWGSLSVSPTRYGVTRYWLIVYPPGIDSVERRWLRAWRAWPTWGAALWLFSLILLGASASWMQFAITTMVWLGAGAALFVRVARSHARIRTCCVTRFAGRPDEQLEAEYAELKVLVGMLRSADRLRDQGRLSVSAHEAIWWQVYDRLGATRATNEHHCP